mmetsp:Transcript_54339/g.157786  ORF Transcript_54339/g.157786 Transcript_54339/m.157786 type:complete len:297 (-) Transcript_54339:6-896(-)
MALLPLVRILQIVVGRLHLRHVFVVSILLRLLRGGRGREVLLEGVAHVFQDADDLAGLGRVIARERRLQERLQLFDLRLLRGDESVCREERVLHISLQIQERLGLEPGHVLPMVLRGIQGLIGADFRQVADGIVHLGDGGAQVLLKREVGLDLILSDLRGLVHGGLVGGQVRVQLRHLLAEFSGGGLHLFDLALEKGDLLSQLRDFRLLRRLVCVAVALVLGVQVLLNVALFLRFLHHVLEKRHNLGDGPAGGRAALDRDRGIGEAGGNSDDGDGELHCVHQGCERRALRLLAKEA